MIASRLFRGFRFPPDVILWAVRWYLQFSVSFRGLELMLADRGVEVDHVTLYRWTQRFAPEIEACMRAHLRPCRGPWHVDETYVRVSGGWRTFIVRSTEPARPSTSCSAPSETCRRRRFFRRMLDRNNTRNPRVVVTDRLGSYRSAIRSMKRKNELWRFARHRRGQWLNNWIEQDHRRVKKRFGSMLGFKRFATARRVIAGVEAMLLLRKGQVSTVPVNDMRFQQAFVASLFALAA